VRFAHLGTTARTTASPEADADAVPGPKYLAIGVFAGEQMEPRAARWALVESAWSVLQQPGPLRAFYERIRARPLRLSLAIATARAQRGLCCRLGLFGLQPRCTRLAWKLGVCFRATFHQSWAVAGPDPSGGLA
jgi:hypothetical protein